DALDSRGAVVANPKRVAVSPPSAVSPLYRGVVLCGLEQYSRVGPCDALPNTIRRYSRLKICATAASQQTLSRCHKRSAIDNSTGGAPARALQFTSRFPCLTFTHSRWRGDFSSR